MSHTSPFADVLGGLPPTAWDALTGNRLYSSHDWLRFCATDIGGTTATGGLHVPVGDGGTAAVAITAVEHEPNSFYQWQSHLSALGLPGAGEAGLLLGQRRGYQTHLLASPGVGRDRAAAALFDALGKLRLELAGSELLPSTPEARPVPAFGLFLSTDDVLALRAAGAAGPPLLLAADAWIPVPDGGWDEWLRSLPSKRRIDMVRRDVKRFRDAGYRITRSTLGECYVEAAELLVGTQARYGHASDPAVLAESFRRQAAAMGDAAQVAFCGIEGEPPVGFCLYYAWGDTLYLRAAGFDYGRLKDACEYFNTVYYEPIRAAAEAGCRWVHAGIEAADAKALRGAELRPLWLLDLAEDSALAGRAGDIRAHNAAELKSLAESSGAVAKAVVAEAFAPFC
ncbi:peptidogalycan biosysnthesis protein [Kitasatospora sp. NPDC017646]|uniref:peptidogalycan biosysnthesis protein n=1 Tax=Kitasatospora sp. NPDC017646 TaxID=3364024 RepID=UPI00379BE4D2